MIQALVSSRSRLYADFIESRHAYFARSDVEQTFRKYKKAITQNPLTFDFCNPVSVHAAARCISKHVSVFFGEECTWTTRADKDVWAADILIACCGGHQQPVEFVRVALGQSMKWPIRCSLPASLLIPFKDEEEYMCKVYAQDTVFEVAIPQDVLRTMPSDQMMSYDLPDGRLLIVEINVQCVKTEPLDSDSETPTTVLAMQASSVTSTDKVVIPKQELDVTEHAPEAVTATQSLATKLLPSGQIHFELQKKKHHLATAGKIVQRAKRTVIKLRDARIPQCVDTEPCLPSDTPLPIVTATPSPARPTPKSPAPLPISTPLVKPSPSPARPIPTSTAPLPSEQPTTSADSPRHSQHDQTQPATPPAQQKPASPQKYHALDSPGRYKQENVKGCRCKNKPVHSASPPPPPSPVDLGIRDLSTPVYFNFGGQCFVLPAKEHQSPSPCIVSKTTPPVQEDAPVVDAEVVDQGECADVGSVHEIEDPPDVESDVECERVLPTASSSRRVCSSVKRQCESNVSPVSRKQAKTTVTVSGNNQAVESSGADDIVPAKRVREAVTSKVVKAHPDSRKQSTSVERVSRPVHSCAVKREAVTSKVVKAHPDSRKQSTSVEHMSRPVHSCAVKREAVTSKVVKARPDTDSRKQSMSTECVSQPERSCAVKRETVTTKVVKVRPDTDSRKQSTSVECVSWPERSCAVKREAVTSKVVKARPDTDSTKQSTSVERMSRPVCSCVLKTEAERTKPSRKAKLVKAKSGEDMSEILSERVIDISHHEFICNVCSTACSSRKDLRNHLYDKHGKYLCKTSYCKDTFDTTEQCEAHLETHRSGEHKCGVCGQVFKFMSELTEHKYKHEDTQVQCPKCDSAFTRPRDLARHMKSHEGKLYVCNICGVHKTEKHQLSMHRVYHFDPEIPCLVKRCKEKFHSHVQRRRHMAKMHNK